MADPARIKRGIYGLAALIVLILAGMRVAGVDRTLVGVLAGAGGLLVALLLITYRAFAGVAEAARHAASAERPDREE
jgi:hypothetical protein